MLVINSAILCAILIKQFHMDSIKILDCLSTILFLVYQTK